MPAFNFQGNAVLGVLAFLGTGALVLLAVAAAGVLMLRGRRSLAAKLAAAASVLLVVYAVTLLLFAAASRDRVLAPGEEKYFCEVDCHLAYSVVEVRRAKALGPPGRTERAGGLFHVVVLKTRFDPETISSRRPRDLLLTPNQRLVVVTDGSGRGYLPSPEGLAALRASGEESAPLERPLNPGESYLTRLVFDLPVDIKEPRLLLTESMWPTRLLIGHENSPGHRKTSFAL